MSYTNKWIIRVWKPYNQLNMIHNIIICHAHPLIEPKQLKNKINELGVSAVNACTIFVTYLLYPLVRFNTIKH